MKITHVKKGPVYSSLIVGFMVILSISIGFIGGCESKKKLITTTTQVVEEIKETTDQTTDKTTDQTTDQTTEETDNNAAFIAALKEFNKYNDSTTNIQAGTCKKTSSSGKCDIITTNNTANLTLPFGSITISNVKTTFNSPTNYKYSSNEGPPTKNLIIQTFPIQYNSDNPFSDFILSCYNEEYAQDSKFTAYFFIPDNVENLITTDTTINIKHSAYIKLEFILNFDDSGNMTGVGTLEVHFTSNTGTVWFSDEFPVDNVDNSLTFNNNFIALKNKANKTVGYSKIITEEDQQPNKFRLIEFYDINKQKLL
jgi:hypothetical protein